MFKDAFLAYRATLSLCALALAGCTAGSSSSSTDANDDPVCDPNDKEALAAPVLLSPQRRALDITSDNFGVSFDAAAFGDRDIVVDLKLDRVRNDGVETTWSYRGELNSDNNLRLSDGTFVDGESDLPKWKQFQVQARVQEKGECRWSEWSDAISFRSDDGSTTLFNDDIVHDIRLDFSNSVYDAINAQARPQGCTPLQRDYHPATVTYDDQVFEHAGLRGKGGCGSSRRLNQKSSFKSNLSWDDPNIDGCAETRRLYGLKRLALNNQVQDPTYISERLTYFLYKKMGVASARVAAMRTTVNDDYWGLYLNVETMDRRFLSRWFESNDGMLYEGTYACDFDDLNNVPDDEDGVACFTKKFSTDECSTDRGPDADPTTFALLRNMMGEVSALSNSNFYPAITEIFDFEQYLKLWAVDTVVDSFDSYHYRIGNNYRVYHDPSTDKWTMLPQGVDQTFGSGDRRYMNPFSSNKAFLPRRCINNDACKAAFVVKLREALAIFESTDLKAMVRTIQNQIRDDIRDEPSGRRERPFSEWQPAVDKMIEFIDDRPGEIRQYLEDEGL